MMRAFTAKSQLYQPGQSITSWGISMFDRFDIAEAYYLYFCHFHEGQASEKYRRLSRMARYFKPRPSLSVETLTENGREMYDALAAREKARTAR